MQPARPRGLGDRPGGRVAVEAHHAVVETRDGIDALPIRTHRHPAWVLEPMAVGAGPRPVLVYAAGRSRRLAERPGGRVAVKARHAVVEGGDVDALSIRADRHRRRLAERPAIGAGPRPVLAHAARSPGRLGDRPGGRVAVEDRHGVARERGDVDALSARAHCHRRAASRAHGPSRSPPPQCHSRSRRSQRAG